MRSKRQGIPFDIDVSDVVVPDVCPILGIPIDKRYARRTDNSPSIDKAVPERGYVKGNVVVISWRANRLKSDASIDELKRITSFYQQFIPQVGEQNASEDHRVVPQSVAG